MYKGKNLLMLAGIGLVGYYVWKMYSKKQATSVPASTNFTGGMDVLDYENANGRYTKPRMSYNKQAGSYNEGYAYSPLG